MKLLFTISLFFPFLVFCQVEDSFKDYHLADSTKMTFGIRSDAFNNSSALTATALNTVFYGGRIENDQKNAMIDRANPINTSGSIWNSSLFFSHKLDSFNGIAQNDLHYFVKLADRQENLGVFTDNALKLVLNGNKQFAGQTISLDPLAFNSFHYTQLQLGFGKDFKSGNGISVGVSFLYGQNNRKGDADRLDVLISDNGDRISTDAELDIYETENTNSFMAYNGAGASLDIQGRFSVQLLSDSSNPGKFHFSITDFGFINWHGSSTHTKVDTFYSYQGVYIDNVFDPNSSTSGQPDNIWDSVSSQNRESFILYTPATIHFYLLQTLNQMEFTIGGAHRTLAYFYPYFYGRFGYHLNSTFMVTGQLNYGGYGNFGGGAEVVVTQKNYLVKLGSTNLEGFINPKKWGGQSLYIQASIRL